MRFIYARLCVNTAAAEADFTDYLMEAIETEITLKQTSFSLL